MGLRLEKDEGVLSRQKAPDLANLASLGDRLGAQILDSVVAVAAIGVSAIPYMASEAIGRVGGFLFALIYILFADGFQDGQSYGKRILKTAVLQPTSPGMMARRRG